ncbi:MAG: NAD(P)H-dependent oxidoreductase subunit E [Proteobacteria bacterium]|nr:NAD(P)H-dependent oxidoreductase subunit E [Pseudomonadota bacterium]
MSSDKGKKSGAVLVAGAGIAGMQASLDLANSGYLVHLVDPDVNIGGTMVRLDKTFPTGDCAMCMISPKMVEVAGHPNIKIKTMTDVVGVGGEPGRYRVRLRERARSVDPDKCTGCGECTQACPVHNVLQVPPKPAPPVMEPAWDRALGDILTGHDDRAADLIAILIELSAKIGYLPRPVLSHLSDRLGVPLSHVYRVATFYAQFRFTPPGKYQISVCQGTACHVRGSGLLQEAVTKKLGITPGETTEDLMFSLDRVACFGACALAPVVVVNDQVYGGMTTKKLDSLIGELR